MPQRRSSCYVCGHSRHSVVSKELSFHSAPRRDISVHVLDQWLEFLHLPQSSMWPDHEWRGITLCSLHFEEDDYSGRQMFLKRILKASAVPTRNRPNGPGPLGELFHRADVMTENSPMVPLMSSTSTEGDVCDQLLTQEQPERDQSRMPVIEDRVIEEEGSSICPEMENLGVIHDVPVKKETGEMDDLGMIHEIVKEEDEWMQNVGNVQEEVAVKEEPEEIENLGFEHVTVKEELEEAETEPIATVEVVPDQEEYVQDPNEVDPLALPGEREDKNDSSPQPEDMVQKSNNMQLLKRPFFCPLCGKAFTRGYDLNDHHRTHTGARPFVCTVCGKSFMRSFHLNAHQRSHSGERPFICTVCGKRFMHSSHLSVHRRLHSRHEALSFAE